MVSCRSSPSRSSSRSATSSRSTGTAYSGPIFDDVDVDYLAKDAAFIQLRWMDLTDIARRLLSGMAQVVRDLDETNELAHLEPIDVGRGLVAIYDRLPKWTERTMRLSSNAASIRELFKRAHDPNQFLFDDIPGTLGEDVFAC